MKLYKKITAAESSGHSTGTTYYSATLDKIIKAYEGYNKNIWVWNAFKRYGFYAIDFDHNLYGSAVVDDTLYICVTNGQDIEVNGEYIDPEDAFDKYTPEDLADYIKPATDKIIERYITEIEIEEPDFTKEAYYILEHDIDVDFKDLVDGYEPFKIIYKYD